LSCDGITIPASAVAVLGNGTVVNTAAGSAAGFVTIYPSGGARPTASNMNYTPGQITPNSFAVRLGSDGAFNIFPTSAIHFIVDLTGFFAP
jgi:hypothetical protein